MIHLDEKQYKFSLLVVALLMMVLMLSIRIVAPLKQAVELEEDINIISSTIISRDEAKAWAKEQGATDEFIKLADLYWKLSEESGKVNPALAYVQSAKETNFGKFTGVLDASYHNPCGLKTEQGGGDKEPSAHKRFETWEEGVTAHLDHLALYAGAEEYPKKETPDPRHFSVIHGKAITAVALGGKWAPDATYGEEIMMLYNDLIKESANSGLSLADIF